MSRILEGPLNDLPHGRFHSRADIENIIFNPVAIRHHHDGPGEVGGIDHVPCDIRAAPDLEGVLFVDGLVDEGRNEIGGFRVKFGIRSEDIGGPGHDDFYPGFFMDKTAQFLDKSHHPTKAPVRRMRFFVQVQILLSEASFEILVERRRSDKDDAADILLLKGFQHLGIHDEVFFNMGPGRGSQEPGATRIGGSHDGAVTAPRHFSAIFQRF